MKDAARVARALLAGSSLATAATAGCTLSAPADPPPAPHPPSRQSTAFWRDVVAWAAATIAGLHDIGEPALGALAEGTGSAPDDDVAPMPAVAVTMPRPAASVDYVAAGWSAEVETTLGAAGSAAVPRRWHR